MAVIIDMDMPESCARCNLCDNGGYCRALQKETDRNYKDRYSRCPLKSTEEMIVEINNLQFIHTELEYNGAVKKVISKDDVLEIINKYCKESGHE